ncbi:hypothetical protein M427DRAFT_64007 [Gonapodya prolifera JEL478]|uniref:FCP1 homology domain-containing protein n=1 Tax=Gonapodya prolifera (strain JEL478) TaxID=1344416 RepID=A0A138ZYE5_GONPJ|nr:hypothetical protein M427DRAFT_64007 [Gonapodya prolifera JEL478]|eukprot:KXS09491.1 hypothetical protein M427DRAFT_64007 [Gonapodya prolifera JEL478]
MTSPIATGGGGRDANSEVTNGDGGGDGGGGGKGGGSSAAARGVAGVGGGGQILSGVVNGQRTRNGTPPPRTKTGGHGNGQGQSAPLLTRLLSLALRLLAAVMMLVLPSHHSIPQSLLNTARSLVRPNSTRNSPSTSSTSSPSAASVSAAARRSARLRSKSSRSPTPVGADVPASALARFASPPSSSPSFSSASAISHASRAPSPAPASASASPLARLALRIRASSADIARLASPRLSSLLDSWTASSPSAASHRPLTRPTTPSHHSSSSPSWLPSFLFSSSSPSLLLAPPLSERKTLVLDLDETLIHSTSRGTRESDHVVEVTVERHVCLYYVYKRPHVDLFLRTVAQWYRVVIFTASMPEYAEPVIDHLDPGGGIVSGRYFRESCIHHNGTYMKDLAVVEPDLSKVFLVDNSPISYAVNQDNGVPIEGWVSDPKDEALLDLLPFLDALRFVSDVRSVLSLRV